MAVQQAGGGDKLAVVVTGNAARAAACLGALEALAAAGLQPDLIVGVSGGAVAGALHAACATPAEAREALLALLAETSWQDLADLDFEALPVATSRPHELTGFLRGDALFAALRRTPLGQQGLQHLNVPVFVLATDLNSGRELVFGPAVSEGMPYKSFALSDDDLDRVNAAAACRASCLAPGLFQPLSLDHYCLVDGTLRQREALAVAAAQPEVGRILWLDAGIDRNEDFALVTDYAGQSLAAGLLQAVNVAGANAFDPHTADPALQGKSVRYINLAVSSMGGAELTRGQQAYESGRRSVQALLALAPAEGGAALFSAEPAALAEAATVVEDKADGPRWQAVAGAGGNVLAVTDLRPPLQQEFGYEFDEYLKAAGLAKVAAKEPQATAEWANAAAERELGLPRLTGLYLSRFLSIAWRDLSLIVATAWSALQLDRGWAKLSAAAAAGVLHAGDALTKKDQPAPAATPPAEPTPEPVPADVEPVAEEPAATEPADDSAATTTAAGDE